MAQAVNEHICEDCGTDGVQLTEGPLEFQYGIGDDEVTLVATVPFWTCTACGFSYTAPGAERAQNDAISQYLGRMRPSEIKALRMLAGLSFADFARALHVGLASVKRWESGEIVPSRSSNKLLTDFRAALAPVVAPTTPTRRFRTAAPAGRFAAAQSFNLTAPFPARIAA